MTEPKDLAAADDEKMMRRVDNAKPMPRPGLAVFEGAGVLLGETYRTIGTPVRRMPTGLERLDRFLDGGFTVPSAVLLGAGPKSAKSTIASAIAEHHVRSGGVAVVIDLENGPRRWARRLLMRQVQIGEKRLTRSVEEPLLDRGESERLASFDREWGASSECGRRMVRYPDAALGKLTPEAVRDVFGGAVALRNRLATEGLANPGMPALIVIDSVQKLPGSLEHRRDVIDGWIRAIEAARYEHPETVALVVSELARKTNAEGYAGFKESGGLEYTADLALGLEPLDTEDPPRDGPAPWPGRRLLLRVMHNRDGDAGPAVVVRTVRPWHGLEEADEDPRDAPPSRTPTPLQGKGRGKGKPGSQSSRTTEETYGETWRS